MADLREIETLARLQLAARRRGVPLRAHASADVRDLIAFCGLEEVLSPLFAPRWAPRHWTRAADEVGARWPG
jgi:hypothetical protein